jgi:hypothetical protein
MLYGLVKLASPEKLTDSVLDRLVVLEAVLCLILAVAAVSSVFTHDSMRFLALSILGWQIIELVKSVVFVRSRKAHSEARR